MPQPGEITDEAPWLARLEEEKLAALAEFAAGGMDITARREGPPVRAGVDIVACIEVRDNGPGFDESVRRHLFDPFFSGRPAGRGLGVGLAKCWRIVQLHEGSIDVEGRPGQ